MRSTAAWIGAALALVTAVSFAGQGTERARDRAVVEQTIRDSIGWALTKDRALLERVITHEADLFIFHPDSTSTVVGWDAFAKNFAFWMDPRFKATSFDVRDLRVTFARSGSVCWFSAMLDDLAEWDGKPTGWKDTRWTGVLEKRGGNWVIVQMHFSFASDRAAASAQAQPTTTADLARLAGGRGGQVFNRAVTAGVEVGRTVARLDARAGVSKCLSTAPRSRAFRSRTSDRRRAAASRYGPATPWRRRRRP